MREHSEIDLSNSQTYQDIKMELERGLADRPPVKTKLQPHRNPTLLEWDDVQRIARIHAEVWRPNAVASLKADDAVHVAYYERLKNNSFVVAINIAPKMKGWPWYKKHGLPINFCDADNLEPMLAWANNKAFWQLPASDKWRDNKDLRWHDVFLNLCLDYSESRIDRPGYAARLCELIADALRCDKIIELDSNLRHD
jgi:hypothetical protein